MHAASLLYSKSILTALTLPQEEGGGEESLLPSRNVMHTSHMQVVDIDPSSESQFPGIADMQRELKVCV